MKISKEIYIRKYSIKEKYDLLPYKERAGFVKRVCKRMEISSSHLRKIWAYKITDVNEALPSQLQILAEELECTIDQLIVHVDIEQELG